MIDAAECFIAGDDQCLKGRVAIFNIFRHGRHDQLASELAQAGYTVTGIGHRFGEVCAHDRTRT